MPTPRIGSGGNDLFLFTQARAAINDDADLKAANLVIEVKEGVVTLSGAVASAALKSKAEQLARGAGAKDVRNQIRVSAAR
jgi:osmotically-inducible protein OsmY